MWTNWFLIRCLNIQFPSQQTWLCVVGGAFARRLQFRCQTADIDFVETVDELYKLWKDEKSRRPVPRLDPSEAPSLVSLDDGRFQLNL